jgi:hypothetical protein
MPLDATIRVLAIKRIEPLIEERRFYFGRVVERIDSAMQIKGMGRSGALLQAIHDACVSEVEARTLLAWSAVKDVLAAAGVQHTETLASELLAIVDKGARRADVRDVLRRRIDSIGGTSDAAEFDLDGPTLRALAKRESDIDLYTLALVSKLAFEHLPADSIVNNFHGPVGAHEIGAASTPTATQINNSADSDALRRALDLVEVSLPAAATSPGLLIGEVLELVDETRAELAKARPNAIRFRTIASGVATAIQPIGTLQPAYQALKAALLPFGVLLP